MLFGVFINFFSVFQFWNLSGIESTMCIIYLEDLSVTIYFSSICTCKDFIQHTMIELLKEYGVEYLVNLLI